MACPTRRTGLCVVAVNRTLLPAYPSPALVVRCYDALVAAIVARENDLVGQRVVARGALDGLYYEVRGPLLQTTEE